MARVEHVADGDTITVRLANDRKERVRLIGIDAPEVHESPKLDRDVRRSGQNRAAIQALGRQAWEFTKRVLPLGQMVELQRDVEERDRYGRLLAYVWTPDGVLLNLLILRQGYAQVLTVPPNVNYQAVFRACQQEAREARRGLWRE